MKARNNYTPEFKAKVVLEILSEIETVNQITLTPHQLRHGYATMLFEAGICERDAMDLLGHADINLTKNIYTHIRKSRKEETAVLLNKAAEKF